MSDNGHPAKGGAGWHNRIVGHGEVDPESILANEANWRVHPRAQQDALSGAIAQIGVIDDVIINRRTSEKWGKDRGVETLLDGHLRVTLALRSHQPSIPVKYVDLEPDEERLALATFDPIAAMAAADREQLDALLQSVNTGDAAVQAMLSELAKQSGLDYGKSPVEDAEPQLDRAEELCERWGSEVGQLWHLGEHRLVCGDCTDRAVVERVMGGERAQLGLTSPPYAVGKEYEADTTFEEHLALLRGVADRALETIVPGGFFFVNFGEIAAQSHTKPLTGSDRQCLYPISKDYWQIFHVERGCDLYAQRVWYKPFNRLQQPFWSYHTSIPHHQEWEWLWTWRMPGGDGDQVYDWDISVHAVWDTRNEATDDKPLTRHTAAFPVCLPERALKAHSAEGAIVWEPFSGSGTTLIACERLGRKCRAIELSPAYVAVSLQRFLDATGKQPQREHIS